MKPSGARAAVALSVAAAVCLAGTANAATKHKAKVVRKTQTFSLSYYVAGSESVHTNFGTFLQGCAGLASGPAGSLGLPCLTLDTPSWAKFMTVKADDASGRPTPMEFAESASGVDTNATETFVCGAEKDMVSSPGSSWTISVDALSIDPSCVGPATTGTITVTVSNLP